MPSCNPQHSLDDSLDRCTDLENFATLLSEPHHEPVTQIIHVLFYGLTLNAFISKRKQISHCKEDMHVKPTLEKPSMCLPNNVQPAYVIIQEGSCINAAGNITGHLLRNVVHCIYCTAVAVGPEGAQGCHPTKVPKCSLPKKKATLTC